MCDRGSPGPVCLRKGDFMNRGEGQPDGRKPLESLHQNLGERGKKGQKTDQSQVFCEREKLGLEMGRNQVLRGVSMYYLRRAGDY